ncbi:MAG: hypothetical protein LC753_15510 [Acidobacteria bacterium]|nr:hypothetical protein [Acidobacteriota bacterium]
MNWNATVGAFAVAQSGQPWEAWSYEPYIALTTSTSDTSRFSEPAGSRRSPSHWQLDLNYTQNFRISRLNLQLAGDLFVVLRSAPIPARCAAAVLRGSSGLQGF